MDDRGFGFSGTSYPIPTGDELKILIRTHGILIEEKSERKREQAQKH